ncbi:MAG TPA: hypothetical protein RMH99_27910 [Sandaracinaceae bacterium LLY-WYZ-13_1]|nr:hypothetical protein [Sandaracinaceae bacterium LLY-WYZ-13_1]
MVRRIPRTLSALLTTTAAGLCALAILWPDVPAEAQRVRCRIYVTQARVPRTLSERGLIRFARRHRARRLRETNDEDLEEREWRANAVFAFNRPPGDLEFHALFYDITDGPRDFVREMSVFVSDRTQRTVLHRINLPRPTFEPNKRIEMVVTLRRQEVGRTRFELIGEEVQHTGMVDFSGGDDDE